MPQNHNLQQLTENLHQITQMHTLLTQLYKEPTLKAINYTPTRTNASSPQDQWLHAKTLIDQQWARLTRIAAELTWRSNHLDGNPIQFIATRLEWAQTHYPYMQDLTETITETHSIYTHLLGEDPEPTQYICPKCAQTQLHYRHQDNHYICPNPGCEGTWTPQQLQNLRHYQITTAGDWVTPKEAATQYGLKPATIRQWIHRGKLIRNAEGKIHTSQIRAIL